MSGLRMMALTFLAAALAAAAGRGELPPSAYIDKQKRAPESLTIKVLSAKSQPVKGTRPHTTPGHVYSSARVEVRAEVTAVQRTKAGLKKGDRITIAYTRVTAVYKKSGDKFILQRDWAGPSEPPLLKKGELVPAYLRREKDGSYALAAGGRSFKTVKART